MAKELTGKEILDLPMGPNDAQAKTIREYLKTLLLTLWINGEGFSGKRPLGNSGWEGELEYALVKGDAVDGKIEDEWSCSDVDEGQVDDAIQDAIEALE